MTVNALHAIIASCHQRHKKPLKQQKTTATPPLYKGLPYHFTVYCAHRCHIMLQDLESAGISFMPIGQAPGTDRPPRHFGGERYLKRQQATDWDPIRWHRSWGIQVYTGLPSARDDAPWHDIDFKYEAICAQPEAVLACVQALVNTVANPLLTMTKSGGLRFSCRVSGYLHPRIEQTRLHAYNETLTPENHNQDDAYIEIVGEKGHNCWDARYEIILGNLLDPPVISKEVFFAPIDALRAALDDSVPQNVQCMDRILDTPASLGSCKLDLAKEALLKRGFSYVRQEERIHYWNKKDTKIGNTEVLLWESEGGVWIRASTPVTTLPTDATLITEVWEDTGILPPIPETRLFTDDKMIAVRDGKLSPLVIKRPTPMLHKPEPKEKNRKSQEEITLLVQKASERNVRVLGVDTETESEKNSIVESLMQNNDGICINVQNAGLAAEAEQFFHKRNVESVKHWRERMYLWDQVKDTPVDVRMATPFERGNVCEDPERCEALLEKGGNPSESICPQCPVYKECQERGYLSQPSTLKTSKAQIVEDIQLFLNPQYAELAEQLLDTHDGSQPVCIINAVREHRMFTPCALSKTILKEWVHNWKDCALGNFAVLLLNAVKIRDKSHADSIRRIRTVIQTFEWLEEELIQQMCHINVRGRVVEQRTIDTETGKDLAHYTIEFERGNYAYIPLNTAAADRLATQNLPYYQLQSFVSNQDINILMSIAETFRLGFIDTTTAEDIRELPTVCKDPSCTFWHQLNRFFDHYTRDADAPMLWEDEVLRFWVPPLLHPKVKQVLVTCPALSSEHIYRTFLDEEVEIIKTRPTAWVPGNHVFQIRTGIYPRHTIVDINNAWDVFGVTEIGQHIFWKIQAEIERTPDIKHGIIVHPHAIEQLNTIASYENVRFLTIFRELDGLETAFEEAEVIWIVGMPDIGPRAILTRTQILFGNDDEPLFYEIDVESYRFKDERVQSVYEKTIFRIFTQIMDIIQMDRCANKKVMLITSLRIPEITDRPETLLFDWEDFDVADGLDRLAEVITTRQRFETERDNLTAETSRKKVEEVLGCSTRQANRVLQKLRGGNITRVPFREQILAFLADGEKTTPEVVAAIEGHPKAINTELTRLVNAGDIVKVKRGLYTLPD